MLDQIADRGAVPPTYAERIAQIDADELARETRRLEGEAKVPPGSDGADRGPMGGAAVLRASRMQTVEGRSGGSGNAPTIKTEVRRYEVECRLDYMRTYGLRHHLWAAGMKFRKSWMVVRGNQRVVSLYGNSRNQRCSTDDQISDYILDCDTSIRQAFKVLSVPQRLAVIAVCGEDDVVSKSRAPTLHRGLETLADLWGFEEKPCAT